MAIAALENTAARALFLDRHGLAERPRGTGKGDDLLDLIWRLGFVQLDSINTVARAHDMILYARRPAYRPQNLKRLHERDRALFEHWTHDAALIPMEFYRHWHLRFQRDARRLRERWRDWRRDGFEARFEPVLTHIRDHGPALSSDVGTDERRGSGGWWDWHPSKTALEYLWRSGALTVVGREGFQKRYDLTERVIESHLCPGACRWEPQETVDWLCNGALDRLGFATSGELAAFWGTVTSDEARQWCAQARDRGQIEPVEIVCADGARRRVFMRPETLEQMSDPAPAPNRLRVLSPFDPALRDRNRAQRLFGFHYRIEVFVPEARRTYGYYVFPLIEGDRLIGRTDIKAHRDSGTLRVRAVWPEPGVGWGRGRQSRFEAELDRLCRFAGLDRTEFLDGWLRDAVVAGPDLSAAGKA